MNILKKILLILSMIIMGGSLGTFKVIKQWFGLKGVFGEQKKTAGVSLLIFIIGVVIGALALLLPDESLLLESDSLEGPSFRPHELKTEVGPDEKHRFDRDLVVYGNHDPRIEAFGTEFASDPETLGFRTGRFTRYETGEGLGSPEHLVMQNPKLLSSSVEPFADNSHYGFLPVDKKGYLDVMHHLELTDGTTRAKMIQGKLGTKVKPQAFGTF